MGFWLTHTHSSRSFHDLLEIKGKTFSFSNFTRSFFSPSICQCYRAVTPNSINNLTFLKSNVVCFFGNSPQKMCFIFHRVYFASMLFFSHPYSCIYFFTLYTLWCPTVLKARGYENTRSRVEFQKQEQGHFAFLGREVQQWKCRHLNVCVNYHIPPKLIFVWLSSSWSSSDSHELHGDSQTVLHSAAVLSENKTHMTNTWINTEHCKRDTMWIWLPLS